MCLKNGDTLRKNENWIYKGNLLLLTTSIINYLGTVFNYTSSLTLNQAALFGKELKAMNVLIHKTKHNDVKPPVKCQLLEGFVSSTLNYGCEIWGFEKL